MTKKRLIIYLSITFALTWIPMFVFLGLGEQYDMTKPGTAMLTTYAMLCPAIGMLLTRKLTGEGMPLIGEGSLRLGVSMKNKKWICYVAAFVLPLLYWGVADGICFLLAPGSFDFKLLEQSGLSNFALIGLPMIGMVLATYVSFGALGEELGWRTYLYPKLEEVFGFKVAVLLGGLIWGIWHFPLVAVGHVGTGYWGEPYTGCLIFAVDCISTGYLLYVLTKKSGSVWPAVLLHAFNNTNSNVPAMFINREKLPGFLQDGLAEQVIFVMGSCIVAAIVYLVWGEGKEQKKIREES